MKQATSWTKILLVTISLGTLGAVTGCGKKSESLPDNSQFFTKQDFKQINTSFYNNVKNHHFTAALKDMDRGASANHILSNQNSILMDMVALNNQSATQFLISKGADVNYSNPRTRRTAISLALDLSLIQMNYDFATWLIDQGADINDTEKDVMDDLLSRHQEKFRNTERKYKASKRIDFLLKLIEEKKIDTTQSLETKVVNESNHKKVVSYTKRSSIIAALVNNKDYFAFQQIMRNFSTLNFLRNHPDKNAYDHKYRTPLINAIAKKDLKMVKLLLSINIDVNKADGHSNKVPVVFAIANKHADMVELLADTNKLKLRIKDHHGNDACFYGESTSKKIKRKLRKLGCSRL